MPQPPQYERTIDFTERDGDDTDHPGLNQELDAAALSINAIRTNLAQLQRDDGRLAAGVVTPDSLTQEAITVIRGDLGQAAAVAEGFAQQALQAASTANTASSTAQGAATQATSMASLAQAQAQAAQQAAADAAESAGLDPSDFVPKTGGQFTGPVADPLGDLREIPRVRTIAAAGAVAATDLGGHVSLAGNATIALATFGEGDVLTMLNPGATDVTLTITGNAYISGIDALRATMTLRKRGMVSVIRSGNTLWFSGAVQ